MHDGEPDWFSEAVQQDEFERSAEGCGPVLFVRHPTENLHSALPGDRITFSNWGCLVVKKHYAPSLYRSRTANGVILHNIEEY